MSDRPLRSNRRRSPRIIAAVIATVLLGACTAPRKINETNWLYELERNAFEKKWLAFFGSLDEAQVVRLGKVFTSGTESVLVEFENSLDDLKQSKFSHMIDAAVVCEDTRRETMANLARSAGASAGPPRGPESLFDKIKIAPGKPTHLTEEEPEDPERECLTPEEAHTRAFAEGQARKASNPLPSNRKEIEEICHRLHPFGFARYWEKRAAEWCVTAAALKGV